MNGLSLLIHYMRLKRSTKTVSTKIVFPLCTKYALDG